MMQQTAAEETMKTSGPWAVTISSLEKSYSRPVFSAVHQIRLT